MGILPTKSRILDAGERLFALHGYEGTSIRAICGAANVNVASVHYHFKSKDELARAILARRMENLAFRRQQLLSDVLAQGESPSVRSLLETLVLPLAELMENEGDSGIAYVKMVARLLHERPDLVWTSFNQYNADNLAIFIEGLVRALPDLPVMVIYQRQMLATATVLHLLANPLRFTSFGLDMNNRPHPYELASLVIDFVAGGLSAPVLGEELLPKPNNKKSLI